MSEVKYRPDIDGLRAVAVVLVMLFHAKLGCSGGFIGVDVFFVISGFLITGLILKRQETNSFSLADFWSRRIRRILPASTVVMMVTLIGGICLMFPDDLRNLFQSALAHLFMVSNFFFWRTTDYFDGAADIKPLLHTWSLAVEEQFYIVFPVLLIGLGRIPQQFRLWTVAGLVLALFGIGEWGTQNHPDASFYLLPTRAWELLLGALLCFFPQQMAPRKVLAELLSAVGMLLVIFSAFTFTELSPFPGRGAIMPCTGTALVIFANSKTSTVASRILSSKLFVMVGLMSYSLYLWHWPVLAFARYRFTDGFSVFARIQLLLLVFPLSYLSWKFLEQPIRYRQILGTRSKLATAVIVSAGLVIATAVAGKLWDGFPGRFSSEAIEFSNAKLRFTRPVKTNLTNVTKGKLPRIGAESGPPVCLVWGDSHADALIPAMNEVCSKMGLAGIIAVHSNNPPLLEFATDIGLREDAPEFNDSIFQLVIRQKIQLVVMSAAWSKYEPHPQFEESLSKTVRKLVSQGIHVGIVRDVPWQKGDVPRSLAFASLSNRCISEIGVPLQAHRLRNEGVDRIFETLHGPFVTIVDPAPTFVDSTGLCRAELDGDVMYRDSDHLTIEGALRLVPLFKALLDSSGISVPGTGQE